MDSLITAAARALAAGDPLGALQRVALREDAPALALRGIAMSQLGDFARARSLLRRAARAFGPREAVARARCAVAEAETALVSRELGEPTKALELARVTLAAHGDHANAAHACYLQARRLLLIGRIEDAAGLLAELDAGALSLASRASCELVVAGIAMRRLRATAARAALDRAERAARRAGIPPLMAEILSAARVLEQPVARLTAGGDQRLVQLHHIEALLATSTLVVDACRHVVRDTRSLISLERRPVLFALAQSLAEAWPGDVPRATLIAQAFRTRHADDSHRARLRVEVGRLRALLQPAAEISATRQGFALAPCHASAVVVLEPVVDDPHAGVLALLADGEAWSSSALALALGTSQRSVQRALDALASAGKADAFGRGRARRWITPPVPGFPTSLLLPAHLPGD